MNEIGVEDVEHETIASKEATEDSDRNTLLDMLPGRRSSSITESKTVSKVHFTEDNLASKLVADPSLHQLEDCDKLLNQYLDQNYSVKQKKQLIVILFVIFSLCLAFMVARFTEMTAATLFHIWLMIMASGVTLLLAIESANRFERTAVKGILEEISCLLSFCPRQNN